MFGSPNVSIKNPLGAILKQLMMTSFDFLDSMLRPFIEKQIKIHSEEIEEELKQHDLHEDHHNNNNKSLFEENKSEPLEKIANESKPVQIVQVDKKDSNRQKIFTKIDKILPTTEQSGIDLSEEIIMNMNQDSSKRKDSNNNVSSSDDESPVKTNKAEDNYPSQQEILLHQMNPEIHDNPEHQGNQEVENQEIDNRKNYKITHLNK